jgi:hypothetical protein
MAERGEVELAEGDANPSPASQLSPFGTFSGKGEG